MKHVLAIAMLVLAMSSAKAEPVSCQELNKLCDANFSLCLGYVSGLLDALDGLGTIEAVDSKLSFGQATAVTRRWIKNHPESWHEDARLCVLGAMFEAKLLKAK